MKLNNAVVALSALAQETRLKLFRLLVRRGPEGYPAGEIGKRLGIAPATLSFHLTQLSQAGLVDSRREGRSIIYSADYKRMGELMNFLTEHCCRDGDCGPGACDT